MFRGINIQMNTTFILREVAQLAARVAHTHKVVGSNPSLATNHTHDLQDGNMCRMRTMCANKRHSAQKSENG